MQEHIKRIREYSKNEYKKIVRNPSGALKHPFIVPGSQSYNDNLWDWDSWLTNIAIRQIMKDNNDFDEEFIKAEKGSIINFLENTDENGKMPIVITASDGDVFGSDNANIHKPCIAQHAAFIIKSNNGDAEWLRSYIGTLADFIEFYERECYHEESGLYVWIDDTAIGVDNDPCTYFRPNKSSASVYLNCLMYKELLAMAYVFDMLGLDKEKYIVSANKLKAKVQEHLWDERDGMYYSTDVNLKELDLHGAWLHSGAPRHWSCIIQRIDVWSGFMAMWSGIASEEQAQRMVRENMLDSSRFWSDFGICSLGKKEKMYTIEKTSNPSCWLGPIWGIVNYICFKALINYGFETEAKELAQKIITMFGEDILQCGEMHEYYHPDTGKGINNQGFQSWNLLVNNICAWYEGGEYTEEF